MDATIAAEVCFWVSIALVPLAVAISRLKPPIYWFLAAIVLSGLGWALAPHYHRGFYIPRIDVQVSHLGENITSRYFPELFFPWTSVLVVLAVAMNLVGFILLLTKYRGQER